MGKTLEKGSIFENADKDGDGVVTDAEFAQHERMIRLENEDKKEDAQRAMTWFALMGMLLYPFAVMGAIALGGMEAAKVLGTMSATYFVSVAGIVGVFFGSQAYSKGKSDPPKK